MPRLSDYTIEHASVDWADLLAYWAWLLPRHPRWISVWFVNRFGDYASDWLKIPEVDRLVAAGLTLRPGECYAYVHAPIAGGKDTVENTRVASLADYYRAFGPMQEKFQKDTD